MPEAFKGYVATTRISYPDLKIEVSELGVQDDMGVAQWTATGTNAGPIEALPRQGIRVRISWLTVFRFFAGKITKEWAYWNHAVVLEQLGYSIVAPGHERR